MRDLIIYTNSTGEKIEFGNGNILINENDVRNYEWGYTASEKNISAFTRKRADKKIPVIVYGPDPRGEEERIYSIIETDVTCGEPGRLSIGDYYTKGYFVSKENEGYTRQGSIDITLKFTPDYPAWFRDFLIKIPLTSDPVVDGLMYDYRYDYIYGANGLSVIFENDHFSDCHFKLTAFGPFDSLKFAINGSLYEVDASCQRGEKIVLDTKSETIIKTDLYGNDWNVYGDQNFDYDNFAKIPAGNNTLSYNRVHEMEIILYQERSKPKWESEKRALYGIATEDGYYLVTEDGSYLVTE